MINEYSHIGEQFDWGMEPVDVHEIKKIATLIIDRIKEGDPDQYTALVESGLSRDTNLVHIPAFCWPDLLAICSPKQAEQRKKLVKNEQVSNKKTL